MTARRGRAALAVAMLLPMLLLVGSGGVAAADDGADDSSVTKSGEGKRFGGLAVTVSQTKHLGNQVVRVSWTGGEQSTTSGPVFYNNYLQIMQCWGDEDAPQREKCQFGGIIDDPRGGAATGRREIINNGQLDDPNEIEAYKGTFPNNGVVPFESVDGQTTTAKRNPYFDGLSTNEIDYARTSADGTGEDFFEVQTAREAAGLGCGNLKSDGKPRDCWLVVVPRDDEEVNELPTTDGRLETSPLSASNFANAISFRLSFDPVSVPCPLGAEKQVLGNEEMTEATTRWQPVLCGKVGSIFGYLQLGDDLARDQTMTDDPGLALVNRPIPADLNYDNRLLTYAPVGISAIGIGVVIERYPVDSAPDSEKALRGTRVLDLKLNARLVAKLLTQSYKAAVTGDASYIANNPRGLVNDPEFVAMNPEFKDLQAIGRLYSITNPLDLTDANEAVWAWIAADPDAKAFINGKADPWGTKVNKYYQGMSLDRSDFPRADPTCITFTDGRSPLCALDHLAYASDYHSAARGAIRGMTLANDNWDYGPPARWKQNPAQTPGERAVLAFMDSATAARFQIPLAQLQNAAGKFVAPTEDSMDAALAGMKPGVVPGVLETNPASKIRIAYPITEVTYAVTAPRKLSAADAKAYAGFIRFVAGEGQTPGIAPGQLPDGYLPLTDDLRTQAKTAATLIAKRGGPAAAPTDDSDGADSSGSDDGTDTPVASAPVAVAPPVAAPAPESPTAPAAIVPASAPTPAIHAGPIRFVLLASAILGLIVLASRPLVAFAGAIRSGPLRRRRGARAP